MPARIVDVEAIDLRFPTSRQLAGSDAVHGFPAYTTSAGWIGYDDEKLARLCREAVAQGWNAIKLKVGARLDDDIRRCRIAREIIGPERQLMIDANQSLGLAPAIERAFPTVPPGGAGARRPPD